MEVNGTYTPIKVNNSERVDYVKKTDNTDTEKKSNEINENTKLLKSFFNENSEIKFNNGEYLVETVLSSNVTDGGQKVKLKLQNPEKIEQKKIGKYMMDSYSNFRVISMLINNQEIIDDSCEIVISNYKQPYENPDLLTEVQKSFMEKAKAETENDFFQDDDNAYAEISEKKIILIKLKDADDIVKIFHEKGHIDRNDKSLNDINEVPEVSTLKNVVEKRQSALFRYKMGSALDKMYSSIGKIDSNPNLNFKASTEELLMVKKIITEEREASQKALELMGKYNLFPNDKNLTKPKLFYALTISTYVKNICSLDDDFKRYLRKQVDEITNFYQK